ncbi:MAG: class I SAM-dependent methyltransferase [Isosphaeraceae bacterium]
MEQTKAHWEKVYSTKAESEVSWFQEHSEVSLGLIRRTGVDLADAIIDVGGGESRLVDDLLAEGYKDLTVLDISSTALGVARRRLGPLADVVNWIEADATNVVLPAHRFDVWHDRAVFHFLTEADQRARYVQALHHAVKPGGHVIVAAFGPDGPLRCSGLPVVRYSPDRLHDEFGATFNLIEHTSELHHTPFGTEQQFIYCYCRTLVGNPKVSS